MEPKLIITAISEKQSYIKLAETVEFQTIPASISFDYEISVTGYGNFNEYLKNDKTFDNNKLGLDILLGKIKIIGKFSEI